MSEVSGELPVFKTGDRVRVAANADDAFYGKEIFGTVTNDDPTDSQFEQYILEGRLEVLEHGGLLDQWVRPQDLALFDGDLPLGDKEALDKIAKLVEPYEGEWSDMSGILESIGNTVEATGRKVIWE